MNHDIYNRVRNWFDQLDESTKTRIMHNLGEYPPCDELTQGSSKYYCSIRLLRI